MYKTYLKEIFEFSLQAQKKKFKKRPLLFFFFLIFRPIAFFSNAQEEEFEKYIRYRL